MPRRPDGTLVLLVASGSMPNLLRLVREGRSGVLRGFGPYSSPLVWTTMMTGVSPLQHRILTFTRSNPQTGAQEPTTSDERLAKAVWEMANPGLKPAPTQGAPRTKHR